MVALLQMNLKFDESLKEFRVPMKPLTTFDIKDNQSALGAPATPEPQEEEPEEEFFYSEKTEGVGVFDDQSWVKMEVGCIEEEVDMYRSRPSPLMTSCCRTVLLKRLLTPMGYN
ncbi:hypothetical protein NDU88_008643 [Pleurodeles waltl]|uniref:Uncharacterized protein n=1 Tax=Pleurodeles waltl TaxID=8319 RepID=A0AAV7PQZ6_PLEWA|nr:hypothetical protein NDU88_008643 [Pleurodeles waltl]